VAVTDEAIEKIKSMIRSGALQAGDKLHIASAEEWLAAALLLRHTTSRSGCGQPLLLSRDKAPLQPRCVRYSLRAQARKPQRKRPNFGCSLAREQEMPVSQNGCGV
jgi:hypothetical protein